MLRRTRKKHGLLLGQIAVLGLLVMLRPHGSAARGASDVRVALHPLLHGGVTIDAGYTETYEWLVALGPYPVISGEAIVTLNVFDVDTAEPVTDLDVSILLAPPGSAPCCDPSQHRGPIPLTTDPIIFPGDYSATVPFDVAGTWTIEFTASPAGGEADKMGDETLKVLVTFNVEAASATAADTPLSTVPLALDWAVTEPFTPVAGSDAPVGAVIDGAVVDEASTALASPLQAPSPLSRAVAGDGAAESQPRRWVLWGVLLLLPLVVVGGWMLREPPGKGE